MSLSLSLFIYIYIYIYGTFSFVSSLGKIVVGGPSEIDGFDQYGSLFFPLVRYAELALRALAAHCGGRGWLVGGSAPGVRYVCGLWGFAVMAVVPCSLRQEGPRKHKFSPQYRNSLLSAQILSSVHKFSPQYINSLLSR